MAADGRDGTIDVDGPNPREHPVHRVGVGEDVVRRLPIGVFVGIAEARYPERRRVREGLAKVSRSCACADSAPRYGLVDPESRLAFRIERQRPRADRAETEPERGIRRPAPTSQAGRSPGRAEAR